MGNVAHAQQAPFAPGKLDVERPTLINARETPVQHFALQLDPDGLTRSR